MHVSNRAVNQVDTLCSYSLTGNFCCIRDKLQVVPPASAKELVYDRKPCPSITSLVAIHITERDVCMAHQPYLKVRTQTQQL